MAQCVTNSKILLKKVKDKATIKTEKMRIHVLIIREFGVRGCAVGTEKNNNEYSECGESFLWASFAELKVDV